MFRESPGSGDSREAQPALIYRKEKNTIKKGEKKEKKEEWGGKTQTPVFLISIRVLFSFHVF